MEDDYALFISLALYGLYVATVVMRPREERSGTSMIVALIAAIAFYAALKYSLIGLGIQPR